MTLATRKNDRENLTPAKKTHFKDVIFRGKTRSADAYLDKFSDFDVEILRVKTGKKIKNILLDIDDCIASAYCEIRPENLEHIRKLISQGVKVAIYSNCESSDRLKPLRDMGLFIYEGNLAKPDPAGFHEVCRQAGFNPEETWMIGENPVTDGGAVEGVLEGMTFVKPVEKAKGEKYSLKLTPKQRIKLPINRLLRKLAIRITLKDNKKIIHSKDLKAYREENLPQLSP